MVAMGVSRPIDVMHLGRDRVICAYQLDGLVVDPGPASCVEALIEGLGDVAPRALLLTHIHLDHAGAAGVLARRFPELLVYVHEKGAPHLVDPSKLLESAARLYGDDMERLWGEVAPVPRERVRPLAGGETVEGFRVAYTPGHASHHVSYLHEDSGHAYVGDVAGVRIPPSDFTVAPTPPPDIDVEGWLDSLERVAAWRPEALCLTHFGRVTDVGDQLERVRSALLGSADAARQADGDGFVRALEADLRAAVDQETAERFLQAAPPHQLWLGLERYWRKRKQREGAAA
jgi:glyoxylase-like metal-dependent hydrolase (beta-lactamase superfamily II)